MFAADPRPAIARASQLLEQGRALEAEREVMAAFTQLGPQCAEALCLLGMVRIGQQRPADAVLLLGQAASLLPLHAGVRYFHGAALVLAGQAEAAIGEFTEAVRLQPEAVEAWYALGGQQVRLMRFAEAEESYRRVLALAPAHGETLMGLGATLLELDRAAEAETLLREALRMQHAPLLASGIARNLALAQERQGKYAAALASVEMAERFNPARKLHDLKGDILVGLQRFDEALAAFRAQIGAAPADLDLHKKYNDLLYLLGRDKDEEFLASYDLMPGNLALQTAKAGFLLMSRRDEEAHGLFAGIVAANPGHLQAVLGAANALDRLARHGEAAALLDQALLRHPDSAALYNALAATSLLRKDPEKAAAMAQRALAIAPFYQYAVANLGTAWRLLGDDRDEALNGYEHFVRIFDLEPPEGFSDMESFNAELLGELETLHPPTREFLDQSLRGGTQTRGSLFAAGHPLVARLQRRFDQAVQRYIAELHGAETHPLLARRGKGFSYSGSWSSRLSDCGFHVNHIHPEGWISSCYYAGVPDVVRDGEGRQGWIKFGEPAFDHGLEWRRALQPAPGRLVLFPSYMWHGTIAFRAPTARTTIAFDVVPAPP